MPASELNPNRTPLNSIVIATDFSPGAIMALCRTARLPLAPRARVTLLHVQPGDLPRRRRGTAVLFAGQRLERAVLQFTDLTHAAGNLNVRVTGRLARGQPFVEILRYARRSRAELIVLGRHGRRAYKDLLIGTTAQRIVRMSDVPVLLVNLEPAGPYRHPILATDLESTAPRLAELAARLLDPRSARVSVIHAYEIPFAGWRSLSDHGDGWSRNRAPYRDAASKGLRRFLGSLQDLGLLFRARVKFGDPRGVVLAEARRGRADLVILGTHGRSGLSRALLGTVAETVLAEAPCDVLIARPPGLRLKLP